MTTRDAWGIEIHAHNGADVAPGVGLYSACPVAGTALKMARKTVPGAVAFREAVRALQAPDSELVLRRRMAAADFFLREMMPARLEAAFRPKMARAFRGLAPVVDRASLEAAAALCPAWGGMGFPIRATDDLWAAYCAAKAEPCEYPTGHPVWAASVAMTNAAGVAVCVIRESCPHARVEGHAPAVTKRNCLALLERLLGVV